MTLNYDYKIIKNYISFTLLRTLMMILVIQIGTIYLVARFTEKIEVEMTTEIATNRYVIFFNDLPPNHIPISTLGVMLI